MSNNINSFADNINNLIKHSNDAISALSGIQETLVTDSESVTISMGDTSLSLPSYNNVLNRIDNVERTVETFTTGKGNIRLLDGTLRDVEITTIPTTPKRITDIEDVKFFNTSANWFFEDLMFPKINITIDLKDKVDDDSDRIIVKRVIIDKSNNTANATNVFESYIAGKKLSYPELTNILNTYNIKYFEDDDTVYFPLLETEYTGSFVILDANIENGKIKYKFDSIFYARNTDYDETLQRNLSLVKNDKLRYKETVYTVSEVDAKTNEVILEKYIGYDTIDINTDNTISFYNEPFSNKKINIGIGYNEYDCIFLKGVNERYNITANEWSEAITFDTDTLLFEEDNITKLKEYYQTYVSDFGAEWLSSVKENRIPVIKAIEPNTPTLDSADFSVVQINKHVNASLDEAEIKQVSSSIASLRSNSDNLRKVINKQKRDIQTLTTLEEREKLQKNIDLNVSKLNNINTEYETNVNYLHTYLNDSGAVNYNPKYRIRGFFPIPELKYTDSTKGIGKQDIIGFDIKYRYLKLDENGSPLTTFTYKDNNQNTNTGVYSDWVTYTTQFKERVYNSELGVYEWKNENTADGEEININQLDIPISPGEKVEFKVRAISEAGYPMTPLKSKWSESKIMEFPSNLIASNQMSNILDDVKNEKNNIELNSVLTTAGFYEHINDQHIASDTGTAIYKHEAKNISYDIKQPSGEIKDSNVKEAIDLLSQRLDETRETLNILLNMKVENFRKIVDEPDNDSKTLYEALKAGNEINNFRQADSAIYVSNTYNALMLENEKVKKTISEIENKIKGWGSVQSK